MAMLRKAVIPAAGLGTRQYPGTSGVRKEFFTVVDRDGRTKPVIQTVVEEALAAVEQVCIVCQPGAVEAFREHFSALPEEQRPIYEGKEWAWEWSDRLAEMGRRLSFVEQPRQEGLGHAVWCAREWIGRERFLVLLGDHVYISRTSSRCSVQLSGAAPSGNITALVPVAPREVARFGVARGRRIGRGHRKVEIEGFIEKPDPATARKRCRVDGLEEGKYLAHFGMHVFSPGILEVLGEMIRGDHRENGEFQLTTAQDLLCRREPYQGLLMEGGRFDIGTPGGLLEAQMALALSGSLRVEANRMWAELKERSGEA